MITITPQDLRETGYADAALIDVRSPGEFAAVHATGAINLPLDGIDATRLRSAIGDRSRVLLLCQSGNRAGMACEKLGDLAALDLLVVEGGTAAWRESGLPVTIGKGTISVERQVRIVAGLLVAAGVALGYWVHPAFLALSAFVGCGLVFAGVTDFCGMGLVLARMPWNRRGGTRCGGGKASTTSRAT